MLASVSLAYVTRLTRTSVAENTRADYVRTADRQGPAPAPGGRPPPAAQLADPGGHLHRHRHRRPDGRRASSPSGIFNIHGVGYQLYQGIVRQNTPTVVGFVTILVLVFLLANLLVDLLYAVLDPRIRYA